MLTFCNRNVILPCLLKVSKLNNQIDQLTRQNQKLTEQLSSFKYECKKHQDDLVQTQRKLRDREWEIESLKRDVNSKENTIEKFRSEKAALELELETLRNEMSMQVVQATEVESSVDEFEFLSMRDQLTQLQSDYQLVVDERDNLLNENSEMQSKMSGLQSAVDKYQREAKLAGKNETHIVTKYEVQVSEM